MNFCPQLVMNIPFTAIHFPVYESCKKLLNTGEEDEGLPVQMMAGGMAGGVAALLTNPLDVVKTRLQVQCAAAFIAKTGLARHVSDGGKRAPEVCPATFNRRDLPETRVSGRCKCR